ncbi:GNAT family N-acetyltransferase [Frankia sp. AiPs1]|uniref:hypothetical protein n=1 Tax=Frankia sp. AiPa1 TaxID=573492 RepID=UPI00202B1C15|nr:hypothetical protein [Frankia sp. AiPa1]MCL9760300.1 hypothetical protein [Frankia sp. AiPa1]
MAASLPAPRAAEPELVHCESALDFQRARDLREALFRSRRGIVLDGIRESRRDAESHVFLLSSGGVAVSTTRVQPYPSDLSDLVGLSVDSTGLTGQPADSEVGRLAALPSASAARYSLLLMALGARWLLDHTDHRSYVAYCLPQVLKIYRLVGAKDTGQTWIVPGQSHTHRVIVGTYADAARLGLATLQLSDAEANSFIRQRGVVHHQPVGLRPVTGSWR